MSRYAAAGGSITQEGIYKFLLHLFRQGASYGWTVSQHAGGAGPSIDVSVGGGMLATSANVPYYLWNDAGENPTVTAANPTYDRIDTVIAYLNLSGISAAVTNNQGAWFFAVVPGTAAATPAAPTAAALQAAAGSGNPYLVGPNVYVNHGSSTTVVNSNITGSFNPMAQTSGYVWGGPSNTKGHQIPNSADSVVALLSSLVAGNLNLAITSGTNTGSAGGDTNYISFAGFKLMWGTTASQNINAGGNASLGVTFPISFSSPTGLMTGQSAADLVGTSKQSVYRTAAPSTSGFNITFYNSDTTNGTGLKASWWAFGN